MAANSLKWPRSAFHPKRETNMVFQQQHGSQGDQTGKVAFHPLGNQELFARAASGTMININLAQMGLSERHTLYSCGSCGNTTTGRILCSLLRRIDGAQVFWCLCACEKSEPTVLVQKDGAIISQSPLAIEFTASKDWPSDLARLYDEAAVSFAASAFTASSMACRKILMSCACHEQDKAGQTPEEGKSFVYYVDYIADNVLTFSGAKSAIDAIRQIGNEANHHLQFVTQADAKRSLSIVKLLLDSIYSLPAA